ncbi:MAG: hypothetical protein JWQ97_1907 [Phenylobacterium sp.]|nr:hypothetical protein [Phenylobacterium sp.]
MGGSTENGIHDKLMDHYSEVARDLVFPLLEMMRLSRGLCGDSDKSLIFLVIAARTVQHPDFRAMNFDHLQRGSGDPPPSFGTNVRSLADSLNIPRESVRRRVTALIQDGLIERNGVNLRLTATGLMRLAPIRLALVSTATKYYRTVGSLLQTIDAPAAG